MPAPWQPPRTRGRRPDAASTVFGVAGSALPAMACGAARDRAGEVAGLVPALVGTVDRAVHDQGGALSLSAPHTLLNVPISGARQFAAQSWPLERIRLRRQARRRHHQRRRAGDVRRARSAPTCTTRDALPADPLIAMVPVSLRATNQREAANGNEIGVLMCNLGTHLPDPADRLDTIRDSHARGQGGVRDDESGADPRDERSRRRPARREHAARADSRPVRPPFNLDHLQRSGPRTPLYWNGARLDALYPLSIPVDGQALNITCTSNDDIISFGLTGCRSAVPDLKSIPARLGHELRALERAVGI